MKMIVVIMTLFLTHVSAAGFAQKLTYTKKGATLEQIFTEIRKQTGYYVVYAENKVDKHAKLDVNFKATALNSVLDVISNSQNLSYSFDDKNISLKPKEEPTPSNRTKTVTLNSFQNQTIDAKGVVLDDKFQPLPGATVRVKNGKGSTITNEKGEFTLKKVDEGVIIEITFIGFKTKDVELRADMGAIIMELSDSKLDEVQVMAYGKTSKRISTGNITTVTAEEIARQPVSNPLLALQGRVPNLIITPAGGVNGAKIDVQLRGQNSISGVRSQPLFIVDGVPYTNNLTTQPVAIGFNGATEGKNIPIVQSALSFLDPNSIESISVLTDADATAIYGSRGSNGVILITTKKGTVQNTTLYANVASGFSEVAHFIPDMMNTQQYLDMRRQAFINDDMVPQVDRSGNDGYAPDLLIWDENRYTDWQKEFLGGTAKFQRAAASINGGSQQIQYTIGINYGKEGYITKGDNSLENFTGHYSLTGSSANNKFKATLTGNYRLDGRFAPATDFVRRAVTMAPNAPAIYNPDGTLNWEPNLKDAGIATWSNPYASLLITTESKTNAMSHNLDLSYFITSKLSIKGQVGFNETQIETLSLSPKAAEDPAITGSTGSNVSTSANSRSWSFEPLVNYIAPFSFGEFNILAGTTLQGTLMTSDRAIAYGYNNDAFLRNYNAASGWQSINSSNDYKYMAFFARLNYNFKDKYIVNLSARRDGSSRFGANNLFGNFWSVGSAWVFTNEKFLKDNSSLSFGKLRFSYGKSGNDGIGDHGFVELFTIPESSEVPGGLAYQGTRALISNGIANPNYQWEDIRKAEIALETGFFKDRLLFNIAYYRHRSSDQLGNARLPATVGMSNLIFNQDATIQNSGLELMLTTNNIRSASFQWKTNFNIAFNRNKYITEPDPMFGGLYSIYAYRSENPIGKPFDGLVAVKEFRGVNPLTGLYQYSRSKQFDGTANSTSDIYEIENQATLIDINPKFSGGMNNSFSYKGWNLNIFIDFRRVIGRNYLYDLAFRRAGLFRGQDNGDGNRPIEYANAWRQPGDVTNFQKYSQVFSSSVTDLAGQMTFSDAYYTNASFIKLRNVSLSYAFPQNTCNRLHLKNLSVFLQGQNLLTISHYKGLDPEVQSVTSMPQLRTITAGLQLSL